MILEHDAMFYRSEDEFVRTLAPFLREGMHQGEAAVAVTTARNIGALRDELGAEAASVRFVDAEEWYLRPPSTIAGYDRVLGELTAQGAPRVRVIGEVQFGATVDEHVTWTRYEAAINRSFQWSPAWIVCPYDTTTLPQPILEHARNTHPSIWESESRGMSDRYVAPERFLAGLIEPTVAPIGPPTVATSVRGDLGETRHFLSLELEHAGVPRNRLAELVVAANEIVTNALRHGGGDARVSIWSLDTAIICEVRDRGEGFDDPLAGYIPPTFRSGEGGMGLWLARQLSDSLTIYRDPPDTVVRLVIARHRAAA